MSDVAREATIVAAMDGSEHSIGAAPLDCAEEAGPVVVRSNRRRSRLLGMLFGSVSHTVARETTRPAIIVPSEK